MKIVSFVGAHAKQRSFIIPLLGPKKFHGESIWMALIEALIAVELIQGEFFFVFGGRESEKN